MKKFVKSFFFVQNRSKRSPSFCPSNVKLSRTLPLSLETVLWEPTGGCLARCIASDQSKTRAGLLVIVMCSHSCRYYSWRSKVQLSTKKVQLFACDTTTKGKIGRCNVHKKGAARFARRAFFVGVGPSNFAFCASVTGEKLHLFSRKLHL